MRVRIYDTLCLAGGFSAFAILIAFIILARENPEYYVKIANQFLFIGAISVGISALFSGLSTLHFKQNDPYSKIFQQGHARRRARLKAEAKA